MSLTLTLLSAQREKHKSLWLVDGNIVLAADSSMRDCTLLFKVHKSVLAMHSNFFADMFTLPTPKELGSDKKDTFEGLPLIYCHDDAAEDWVKVLSAIYQLP